MRTDYGHMAGDEGDAVLVPSSNEPHPLACVRSLSRHGVRTIVASEQESSPVFASRYCDEGFVVPSLHDDLVVYKEALLSLAAREDVRTILPTREEDAYLLAKYWSEFEDHVTFVSPPLETLRQVHDRRRLFEAAENAGVPAPATWLLGEIDDWNRELIVKPRYSILADEYVDTHSPSECDPIHNVIYLTPGLEPDRDAIREQMLGHEPIVQEFVPTSDEYMFAALYDHGEPVSTFQHRQIRGHSYAGGGSVYRESVDIPRLEEVGRTLLDHLDWHGLACIEYMEDARTGELKLTEINPRFWRSLPFTIRAGADFPYDYWLLANGERTDLDRSYEVGLASHFLYGEMRYLESVLREENPLVQPPSLQGAVWDIASSIFTHPQFDYLSLDDPGPFVRGVLNLTPFETSAIGTSLFDCR